MSKILYAEDDAMLLDICGDYLIDCGFQVIKAVDGAEAMALYESEKPDLLLLDVMMPKMSGIEVAKLIRKENGEIPIIFISSLESTRNVIDGLHAGANDYIRKEMLIEEVVARIEACLVAAKLRAPAESCIKAAPGIVLDTLNKCLLVDDKRIKLKPLELKILKAFFLNVNEPIPKERLVEIGWDNTFDESFRYLDKVLVSLRKMFPASCPVGIITFLGDGYGLVHKNNCPPNK